MQTARSFHRCRKAPVEKWLAKCGREVHSAEVWKNASSSPTACFLNSRYYTLQRVHRAFLRSVHFFFFFFHRQTKSALFPPWKTKHLVMSRSINTFSFFFFLIKNFFQLFPIFIFLIFFPQQIKLIRFDNSFFLS